MNKVWSDPPELPADYENAFDTDLRMADLRNVDLRNSGEVLWGHASFDTLTQWPEQLPAGYDPQRILELGLNPGLGVRSLHAKGITGKGVHVAFIDQTLLVDHEEYTERIQKYAEIGEVDRNATMHGGAVASILAGKSGGVAPDATVTYYAVQTGTGGGKRTFTYLAQAINRILDENAALPESDRIRVIGASIGWGPDEEGFADVDEAVKRAKAEGVFVIFSNVQQYYDFDFHGLDRDPLADPDAYQSYRPGSWFQDYFYRSYPSPEFQRALRGWVLVPMDSRTTASPTGQSDYVFYRVGGWSWSIPYLVGVYALGLQVRPELTPSDFYQAAMETGWYATYQHDGADYRLGPIINPAGIVERLQKLK